MNTQNIAREAAWEYERVSMDGRCHNHKQLVAIIQSAMDKAYDQGYEDCRKIWQAECRREASREVIAAAAKEIKDRFDGEYLNTNKLEKLLQPHFQSCIDKATKAERRELQHVESFVSELRRCIRDCVKQMQSGERDHSLEIEAIEFAEKPISRVELPQKWTPEQAEAMQAVALARVCLWYLKEQRQAIHDAKGGDAVPAYLNRCIDKLSCFESQPNLQLLKSNSFGCHPK